MARFAKLSLGAHGAFDAKVLSPELRTAVQQGMEDAWKTFKEFKKRRLILESTAAPMLLERAST